MSLAAYFFLNPAGHLGLTAFTFFVNLPFTQVIVDFFITVETGLTADSGEGVAVGVGEGSTVGATGSGVTGCAFALCVTFIFMTGAEKWNPAAETSKVFPTTLEDVVTTSEIPSSG